MDPYEWEDAELIALGNLKGHETGWKDNFASLVEATTGQGTPDLRAFGPTGNIKQRRFKVNDSVYIIWHIDHDVKPRSTAYMHVHWAAGTTDVTNPVSWEISYTVAKGHNQEAFGTEIVLGAGALEEVSGGQWFHMVTEDATGFTIPEPDSLIIAEVKRIAPTSGNHGTEIFGLFVDIHYQSDREITQNRSPNFYGN